MMRNGLSERGKISLAGSFHSLVKTHLSSGFDIAD
jgi:hypothetical protein